MENLEALRGMSPKEAVDMMERCKQEIVRLRIMTDHLKPKAEAYDTLAAIVGLLPKRSQGESIDLVWSLDKRIAELTPKPANTTEPAQQ